MVTRYSTTLEKEHMINNINIIKMLDHPNIIKNYEVFNNEGKIFLVTDVYKGDPLMDKIVEE